MAYVRVWIHAVWGTKNRFQYLNKEIKPKVISHIKANAKEKGIYIKAINGYTEHLHCLYALNSDMTIAKSLQLIKGESAFWINKHKLTSIKFEWADEYYAGSVSEPLLQRAINYIENQEEHHKEISYDYEISELKKELKLQHKG